MIHSIESARLTQIVVTKLEKWDPFQAESIFWSICVCVSQVSSLQRQSFKCDRYSIAVVEPQFGAQMYLMASVECSYEFFA